MINPLELPALTVKCTDCPFEDDESNMQECHCGAFLCWECANNKEECSVCSDLRADREVERQVV